MSAASSAVSSLSSRRQGIFWLCTLSCARMPALPMLQQGELPPGIVWVRGQQESGDASGYVHWQFMVATKAKTSLAALKKILGRGFGELHAELSRSEAANEYVCKESTRVAGPWEHGAKPIRRNSKVDWEDVWTAAQSGDLARIPPNVRVVSYRTLRAIAADFSRPEAIIREVWVFWGISGSGKSRRAWDEAGLDAYGKCPRSKFWDGYQGQEAVVFDEFRGGIDVSHILRWCDRYPVRVEIKGSSCPLVARKIWFTSNLDPRLWYPELDQESVAALIRRFNIIHFN